MSGRFSTARKSPSTKNRDLGFIPPRKKTKIIKRLNFLAKVDKRLTQTSVCIYPRKPRDNQPTSGFAESPTNTFGPTPAFNLLRTFFTLEVNQKITEANITEYRDLFSFGCYSGKGQFVNLHARFPRDSPERMRFLKNSCFICGTLFSPDKSEMRFLPPLPLTTQYIDPCETPQAEHILPSGLSFFLLGLPPLTGDRSENMHALFLDAVGAIGLSQEVTEAIRPIITQNQTNGLKQYYNFSWAHRTCNQKKNCRVIPNILNQRNPNEFINVNTTNINNNLTNDVWNEETLIDFTYNINRNTLRTKFRELFQRMVASNLGDINTQISNNVKFICCVALFRYYTKTVPLPTGLPDFINLNIELAKILIIPQAGGSKQKGGFKPIPFINEVCVLALLHYFKEIKDNCGPETKQDIEERISWDTLNEFDEFDTEEVMTQPVFFSQQMVSAYGGGRRKTRRRKRTKRTKHRKTIK